MRRQKNFNIPKILILLANMMLALVLSTSLHASQVIDISNHNTPEGLHELATKLAPQYRFHPYEQTFPMSIETLLKHSSIDWDQVDENTTNPTKDHLTAKDGKGPATHLRSDKDRLVIKQSASEQRPFSNNGYIADTTIYVTKRESAKRLYIIYSMLMPFSDCQIFRTRIYKRAEVNQNGRRRNFKWCNAARHYGDWENAVVVIDNADETGKILGIVTSAHGHETFTPYEKVNWFSQGEGKHPRILVSLNTHALYPMAPAGQHQPPHYYTSKGSSLKPLVELYNVEAASQPVWKLDWLRTIDLVTNEFESQLVKFGEPAYVNKQGHPASVIWNSWGQQGNNKIELIEGSDLENWEGRWGQTQSEATNMGNPSGSINHVDESALVRVFENVDSIIDTINFYGDIVGELPAFTSPNSPWDSGWYTKDPYGNEFAKAEDLYHASNTQTKIKTLTFSVTGTNPEQRRLNVKKLKAIGQNNLHKWTVKIHKESSHYQDKHIRLQLNGIRWNNNSKKSFGSPIENTGVGLELDESKTLGNPQGRLVFVRKNKTNYLQYNADNIHELSGEQEIIYLPIIKRDGTTVIYRFIIEFSQMGS